MSRTDYDESVACSRLHFEEGLIRAGFTETDAGWQGPVPHSAGTTEVMISLGCHFPFQPPGVVPVDSDAVAWSWHRDLDGALCLVAEDDHDGLWWTEAEAFLEHISAWFEQAQSGWPDDRPDLDLDRYFPVSEDTRLYLYNDLAQYRDRFVLFRPDRNNTMRIKRAGAHAKTSKRKNDRLGYIADLGEVNAPPRSWDDIAARVDRGAELGRRIGNRTIAIVALTYRRGAHEGAIVLEVGPANHGGVAARRVRSAADTDAAKTARAGPLAPELRECRVAVVGVGALGSFIADMFARSGIGHLTLVDHDLVLPGNLVRHLAGPETVGLSKVTAVRQHLIARHGLCADKIEAIDEALTSPDSAAELIGRHDLVVDATADFSTTALLHVMAESLARRIVSAVLHHDGMSYRIDLLPPFDGAVSLPPSNSGTGRPTSQVVEAGCGSPLSPTPPYAVIEAAAATVRHAIGVLVASPLDPAGEVRNLLTGAEGKCQ